MKLTLKKTSFKCKMSTYDYTFKVLLLGDKSTEKSAITKQYCYNIFNPSERLAIGVDFHVKLIEFKNRKIKLQIWDIGEEERYKFLLPTYCLGANAAFLKPYKDVEQEKPKKATRKKATRKKTTKKKKASKKTDEEE